MVANRIEATVFHGAEQVRERDEVASCMTECHDFWQAGVEALQIWQDKRHSGQGGCVLCGRSLILANLNEGDEVELTTPIVWGDGLSIPLKDVLAQILVNTNRMVGLPSRTGGSWGSLPPDSVQPVGWVEQVKTDVGITRATVLPLADDENKLVMEIRTAKDQVVAAINALPPTGAPTDEQIQDIVDKLNIRLGGGYDVTITPKP